MKKCKYRFYQIDPTINRGKWSKEEDLKLENYVQSFGYSWKFISNLMKKRSGKQIRSRYINYIFKGIKKTSFTEAEDILILDNYKVLKNQWVKYCQFLKDRSPRQIENRAKYLLKH